MAIPALPPALELLLVTLASAAATEALLWAWAYRQPAFVSLKAQVERQGRKLESMKSAGHAATSKKNRKVDRLELHLKEQATRQLATLKLKQTLVMGASLFLLFRVLANRYDGVTMAKLPFQPFPLLRKLTQRGLPQPRLDDCAFAFLYTVLNVCVRPTLAKALDLGPSRRMLDLSGANAKPAWAAGPQ